MMLHSPLQPHSYQILRQLTAAEIQKHPEFPHVAWPLKPDSHGKLAVAKGRGGPFNIAWEIHGHGPRHLVLVMGLGGLKSSWQRQTYDFGHKQGDKFSVLIFDNRGLGESDVPFMRYSTSEMARDTIDVLDHVGWTAPRSVHLLGISMGGMIAQEMAILVPERLATLFLVSTAARIVNTVGFLQNIMNRVKMFMPKSLDQQIASTKRMLYTPDYLEKPDDVEAVVSSFPTNGDRFGAMEVRKRLSSTAMTPRGFMSQAIAAGWHYKSPQQIEQIANDVGRERIYVIHGTNDLMVPFPHGQTLATEMGRDHKGLRVKMYDGQGHVIPIEKRADFGALVEEHIEMAEKLN